MGTHCPHCDAELPPDSLFCPACGQPVDQAATGATQQLHEQEDGVRCSHCGTANPSFARFCVTCGKPMQAAAFADAPAAPPTILPPLNAPQPPVVSPHAAPMPAPQTTNDRPSAAWSPAVPGALFLLGLALLAWTGWWWPGILVLVGLSAIAGSLAANKAREGLMGGFWLLGLAVIAQFNWWWPGILVLVALSALVGAGLRGSRGSRQAR